MPAKKSNKKAAKKQAVKKAIAKKPVVPKQPSKAAVKKEVSKNPPERTHISEEILLRGLLSREERRTTPEKLSELEKKSACQPGKTYCAG